MKELSYPSSMPVPALSVVIPVYNEQGQIEGLLKEWSRTFTDKNISHEFIVINDGSLDGTSRVLDRLRRETPGLRIVHQLNSGHGKAVMRGYEMARADWVLQLDSSGRFEPSDFEEFWNSKENYDLVVANRTHRLDPFYHRFCVKFLSSIIESLFKIEIPDPDASFRLFKRVQVIENLKRLPAAIRGINLAMTVIMKKKESAKVGEVKIPYRMRALTKGRVGVWETFRVFRAEIKELLQIRYLVKAV